MELSKMNKYGITWNQFSKIYGVGMTEHIAHDVEIKVGRFGPKMVSDLNDKERATFYNFNVYNLETDNDVFTYDYYLDTMDEIFDIIASEFNIID